MSEDFDGKRIRERLELRVPVRVRCRETPDFEWTEVTRLTSVTPFGAGFTLKRPTERGRLLHMTIPMPRQLRVFDHVEDQYKIWALVRYAKRIVLPDKPTTFNVGVAFVGKRAPTSFESEPWKRYEISTSTTDSLAALAEMDKAGPTADERILSRHNIAVDMYLEILNQDGETEQSENTVTENINGNGATLYTSLQVPTGRFVRVTSEQYKTTAYAAVRSRSTGGDGIPRIHIEFIDIEWPL